MSFASSLATYMTLIELQDDFPLASLPLLGYTVQLPSPADGIQKDFVFKLQFKNHIYLFRAESQYTFERSVHSLSSDSYHQYVLLCTFFV